MTPYCRFAPSNGESCLWCGSNNRGGRARALFVCRAGPLPLRNTLRRAASGFVVPPEGLALVHAWRPEVVLMFPASCSHMCVGILRTRIGYIAQCERLERVSVVCSLEQVELPPEECSRVCPPILDVSKVSSVGEQSCQDVEESLRVRVHEN